MEAKLKPLSGCYRVCSSPAPTLQNPVFFILLSAALTSLEGIMVSCHQESPLLHRLGLILGGIGLLFHFMRAPVLMQPEAVEAVMPGTAAANWVQTVKLDPYHGNLLCHD